MEGEVRFFQAQDQPSVTTYVRVGNRVFSHSLDVVSKMHIPQIRCGVLPISLHIETGRYRNLKVEERLCKVCDSQSVENEFHFIFDCKAYSQLRLMFYNWIIMHYPNFFIMSQAERLKVMLTDKRVILKSGLYIQNCFLLRTSKLFVR